MPNQFTPDADDNSSEKKRSQQRLLLLLLLLMGLFAYLYFFTGLIKARPETAQAPPPSTGEPAEVVKQPLPPRPEGDAAATAPAAPGAAAPGATAPAAPAPVQAAAPAGKPGAGAPVAAKPAPAQPAPAAQAKTAKPAAPAATAKPAPPAKAAKPAVAAKAAKPAVAAKDAKPAAAAKAAKPAAAKPAVAAKEAKPAAAKTAAKPAAEAKPAKGVALNSTKAKTAAGAYALEINGDLAESELGSVTAKLKKAGISPVVTSKAQKGEPMHRLFLADFGDRDEAVEELGRLKQVAPSSFMLKENGRYAVYAGSFLRQGKAAVEQDRLYDKGVRLLLKEATIPVPVVKLRAGSFADQASAQKAAGKLKSSGLTAKVVKVGK